MARLITDEEKSLASELLQKARAAMKVIEPYDQARVDDLCRAVSWATANEKTFVALTKMSVDESNMGSAEGGAARRFKVVGILRDALRQKSIGVIEEIPEKGIVKYAKPVGVIAGLLPVTNPVVTMVAMAINALKCRDAVIFSPHPASKRTAVETTRILRAALKKQGAPEDCIQCIEKPSIPLAQELMSICDLTIATGGPAMVKAAYGSGKPAYGVGAGNATMVIDETADIAEAAANTRISKTHNNGSGCSCDGNLLVEATIYDKFLEQLQKEGGYLASEEDKKRLQAVMWDSERHRTLETDCPASDEDRRLGGIFNPSGQNVHHRERRQNRKGISIFGREAFACVIYFQVQRFRQCAEDGRTDFRGRRQRPFVRNIFVRQRTHPPARVDGSGQPNYGEAASGPGQRGIFHERNADDGKPRLRNMGREYHQ